MDVPLAPSSSTSVGEPPRASPPLPPPAAKVSPTLKTDELSRSPSGANGDANNAPDKKQAGSETALGLTRSERLVAAVVLTVLLALLILSSIRLTRWGTVAVEIERLKARQIDYRLDVNAATWVEWTQLDGIGDSLARRIVADREANGPFSSIDELRRVKGIGPKTLEKIRPWLTIDPVAPDKGMPAR
jgi:competence protein ComEA